MNNMDDFFRAAAASGYGVLVINQLTIVNGDQSIDSSTHTDNSQHLTITNPRPSMPMLSDGVGYRHTIAPLEEGIGDMYRDYRRLADAAYFNRSR